MVRTPMVGIRLRTGRILVLFVECAAGIPFSMRLFLGDSVRYAMEEFLLKT